VLRCQKKTDSVDAVLARADGSEHKLPAGATEAKDDLGRRRLRGLQPKSGQLEPFFFFYAPPSAGQGLLIGRDHPGRQIAVKKKRKKKPGRTFQIPINTTR